MLILLVAPTALAISTVFTKVLFFTSNSVKVRDTDAYVSIHLLYAICSARGFSTFVIFKLVYDPDQRQILLRQPQKINLALSTKQKLCPSSTHIVQEYKTSTNSSKVDS